MKRFLIIISILLLVLNNPNISYADTYTLIPCKESIAFNKRLKSSVNKLQTRLSKYETGTPPALSLEKQIQRTEIRFNKYSNSGVLCGPEGLPHLIADGRWNHAGEFMLPGLLFLYIAGWIGWVGRGYLQAIAKTNIPTEKEIIIDVPLALKFSLSGFVWPLASLQEFTSGKLLAANDDITVSPR